MYNKSVLILSPFFSPNIGGVESYLDDLVQGLTKRQWRTIVITYSPLTSSFKAPLYEKKLGLQIFRLPWIKFNLFYRLTKYPALQFLYLFLGIFIFSVFYTTILSRRIQVIHGHGLSAGLAAGIIGKLFSKKSIISLYTIYKFKKKSLSAKFAKKILDKANIITLLSKKCGQCLISLGISAKKIKICHCWIDTIKIFKPRNKIKIRNKLNLQQGCFMVLFIGRLTEEKGVHEVIKIIKQTSEKIQFFIIGDGPLRMEVEKLAATHKNVHYLGSVPNKKIPFWLSAADLLLWGSVDQDYVGRVTMHALSCGVPPILPDRTKYFGEERKVGLNIKSGHGKIWFIMRPHIKNISHELEKLSQNPKNLDQMRINCRKFALENYSEEKNIKTIINAYQSCLV
ncbi:MAG: glycosyltransferase family 4 protein [Patescibacteria group bacterium]|nr:glycosyltransferase family 4 protein [Patescibacteria group bacterium]